MTELLHLWRQGDASALDELLPLVYAELHRLAERHLRGERPGHTLRPTDLVSEAYLRLAPAGGAAINDRLHFFAVAARTMRQILVDHARKRSAHKRGDGARPITLDEAIAAPEHMVALEDALSALAQLDERKAKVIELRYFGGLTQDEIGQLLDVHVNTVARDLRMGEAWLHRHLIEP